MFRVVCLFCIFVFAFLGASCSLRTPTQSIPMQDLSGSTHYSAHTKKLIRAALLLSKRNLDYRFGSSDPRRGGMDCSGTMYYLMRTVAHRDIPRDASLIYVWLQRNGKLHYVHHEYFGSSDFRYLKPGDFLFWTGTYYTRRKPPITHVMLYIGKNRRGQRLMFGATTGNYGNKIIRGVGVYDFILPNRWDRARFVAYGCIPFYTCR